MPQFGLNRIGGNRPMWLPANASYENLFIDGGQYVFDGNRVAAWWRTGRNGVTRWRLRTVDPNVSLLVLPDLRVRTYRWIGNTSFVHLLRPFESVFDSILPLAEAVFGCKRRSHVWIPGPPVLNASGYSWNWCSHCGAERVWFREKNEYLYWPEDAGEIAGRMAEALPRLHGPAVGGRGRQ